MSEPTYYTIKVQVLDSTIATIASMLHEVFKYAKREGIDGRQLHSLLDSFASPYPPPHPPKAVDLQRKPGGEHE